MPIYAYKCASCGHAKDVLQKISDPQLQDCPACGQSTFRKQVTAAGFQLKGSGWYVTDFKGAGGGGAKPEAKAGEGAAKSESQGDAPAASSAATEATGAGKSDSAAPAKAASAAAATPAASKSATPAGSGAAST